MQYTEGEPHDLIKGCMHEDGDRCYTVAMKLLDQQYGDPQITAQSYIRELRKWPNIKANDAKATRLLYLFLTKCKVLVKQGVIHYLNSIEGMLFVICKFPMHVQDAWNKKSAMMKYNNQRVTFDDLLEFIGLQTYIADNPNFSRDARAEFKGIKDGTNSTKIGVQFGHSIPVPLVIAKLVAPSARKITKQTNVVNWSVCHVTM